MRTTGLGALELELGLRFDFLIFMGLCGMGQGIQEREFFNLRKAVFAWKFFTLRKLVFLASDFLLEGFWQFQQLWGHHCQPA